MMRRRYYYHGMPLDLDDTPQGEDEERQASCPTCQGDGTVICSRCAGTGSGRGSVTAFLEGRGGTCWECGGSGEVPCPGCAEE